MKKKKKLLCKALLLTTVGPFLLGSNGCTTQIRDAAISAGAAFVGVAVSNALDVLLPVDTLLTGTGG